MRSRSVFRTEQWWDHKVPPVITVGALAIGAAHHRASGSDLVHLVLVLCSAVGVAAFGHLVNDWADVSADASAGKPNRLADVGWAGRLTLVAAALSVGLVPWLLLPRRPAALVALAIEVGLLVAYSVPPVRLKGHGVLGAVADALYAYAIPFVLTALALGPSSGSRTVTVIALGWWGFLMGLRGILWHQVGDAEADRRALVQTAARRIGVARTERLVASVLLPLEVVSLAVLVGVSRIAWLPALVLAFVVWRSFQIFVLWSEPVLLHSIRERRQRVRIIGFEYLNDLVEDWLPLVALLALALARSSSWWWLAAAVHLVLFPTTVRHFFARDSWVLPDAVERLAFTRRIRADIQRAARRRADAVALGALPLDDPTRRRWVFVVCGPVAHTRTLRTAVDNLRPLTQAEIWLVTDPARNAEPVLVAGIDHQVDVVTPPHLDDHQASIWLKTSVHRHLPPGEWCYLDSDIIAVAPGIDEIFDHRDGPVAFASDLTIRENSVDRFSPWAMTCSCLGYDDEHSCGHLRRQLLDRFGIEVPGDWLHWNGGVFVFGPEAAPVLELWHDRAVASFGWPEWKTRDQGALIATAWTLGLQDLPRLPPTFNFIADLGNHDLCLDPDRGWAHHPSGPWYPAKLLHLYTSPLDDPDWDLGRDVEAVVLRRSRVRVYRYRRGELEASLKESLDIARGSIRPAGRKVGWAIRCWVELQVLRARRFPRRLTPGRVARAIRWRLRLAPAPAAPAAPALDREPVPQRAHHDGG